MFSVVYICIDIKEYGIMFQMIDNIAAQKTLSKYFGVVEKTGYVKHDTVVKYLLYSFLLDFVEYCYKYFNEKDYHLIDEAFTALFGRGGAMLPYPVFSANRTTLGKDDYMSELALSITEDSNSRNREEEETVKVV